MYLVLKRMLDIVLSWRLVVLSPFLLGIMLLLRFTGEGEVFFRQKRVGYQNRPFGLIKFVTMRKDSPKSGTITVAGDPRILPVGRYLRKSKFNELPQLLNVLLGDMSIVGPRPLTDETFALYPDDLRPLVYRCKPGLSGLGSLVFRDEEEILRNSGKDRITCYREDIAPLKGALEVWYHDHRSIGIDLKIILFTLVAVLIPGSDFYHRCFPGMPLALGLE
jgi:lipopolysaccharide/colanic/teichoic acid biosynthesis glycosyltransferase